MVLSLEELSLVAVRNNLENGVTCKVDQLSLPLRERLLKLVLMHGTINEPVCLRELSSPEFLQDFSFFNAQCGHVDDHQYLDRVSTMMAQHISIGQGIKDLRLTIYGGFNDMEVGIGYYDTREMNIWSVVQMIASCPRLESLSLVFVQNFVSKEVFEEIGPMMLNMYDPDSICHGFLNDVLEMRPCRTILANLTKLTLSGCGLSMAPFVKDDPMVPFKNLTTLVLSEVNFSAKTWKTFLMVICDKLTLLHLDGVSVVYGPTLPIPLPRLNTLVIHGWDAFECDVIFITNLRQCHKLQCVSLELTEKHQNEECLRELSQVEILSELKIRLGTESIGIDPLDEATIFDDSSKLKFVNLFGEKITSVSIMIYEWTPRWTAAMQHIVQTCHGLTELVMPIDHTLSFESHQELSKTNLFLLPLFSSKEHASKLRKLHLMGGFASNVLDAMFTN